MVRFWPYSDDRADAVGAVQGETGAPRFGLGNGRMKRHLHGWKRPLEKQVLGEGTNLERFTLEDDLCRNSMSPN